MKKFLNPACLLVLAALLSLNTTASAEIKFNGIVRFAYDISDSEAFYEEDINDEGTFAASSGGLNFSATLDDNWSAGGQFFAHSGGEMELEWIFATYRHSDNLSVRLGKQKYPLGLYTETIDVGLTYPVVNLPDEFYLLELNDHSPNILQEHFTGASLVYSGGDEFEWSVQPFTGEFSEGHEGGELKKMFGVKFEAGNDMMTFQAGFQKSDFTFDPDELGDPLLVPIDQGKDTWNVGVKVNLNSWLIAAEHGDNTVENFSAFDTKGNYLMLAYEGETFFPSLVFATLEGQNGALDQDSVALGLGFRHSPSAVTKLRVLRIEPDNPAAAGILDPLPLGDDSVTLFSISTDLVF